MVSPSGHALAGEAVILQPCTSFSFYLIFFFLQQRSHKSKGNKFSPRRQQESGVTNKAVARRFASSISWPAAHLHALLRTVGLIRSDIWITTPPQKKGFVVWSNFDDSCFAFLWHQDKRKYGTRYGGWSLFLQILQATPFSAPCGMIPHPQKTCLHNFCPPHPLFNLI